MTTVHETIPEALAPDVEAALAWFSAARGEAFEVTGIIDPERALASPVPRDLRLVLCGGDACEQHTFRVSHDASGVRVALCDAETASAADAVPAELDPPPGARRTWLEAALSRHAFVVLVFYRGFW